MTRTKGRVQLKAVMKTGGRGAQSRLARGLDVSQNAVFHWCHGTTRPEHHHRLALQRLLSIDANSWMTASERKIAGLPDAQPDSEQPDPSTPTEGPAQAA